ncbi:hypothetical protein Slin15195_G130120 [Septoria linicola]|uniref:Uncharacterized protein n=1 Tax=Septoria linicola TaxID=215465 RepID=A0A9Q9B653_9PEZI|nr:hypothetical protein Slin14017_G122010 [Septoria linicola]USW59693.1 hypothetical protein Slin15195_G130120 [Septoria linicola]
MDALPPPPVDDTDDDMMSDMHRQQYHIARRRSSLDAWDKALHEQACRLQQDQQDLDANTARFRHTIAVHARERKQFEDYTTPVLSQTTTNRARTQTPSTPRPVARSEVKDAATQTTTAAMPASPKLYSTSQVNAMLQDHDRHLRNVVVEEVQRLVLESQHKMEGLHREYCDRLTESTTMSPVAPRHATKRTRLSDELASMSDTASVTHGTGRVRWSQ